VETVLPRILDFGPGSALRNEGGPVERSTDRLAEQEVMKHSFSTFMKKAGFVLLLTFASVGLASADVVGTLYVHTAPDGHRTTERDSGQPVAVQVDFSRTQDGRYDLTSPVTVIRRFKLMPGV
jgi:hypothetical protein